MDFITDMDEQIFRLIEGAMGVHCNREKAVNMPFRYFKKNIESNLNSFLISNSYLTKKALPERKDFFVRTRTGLSDR